MWYCIPKQQTIITPCDIEISGILHPAAIFTAWSKEDLAAIGIVPYREDNASPVGARPVEWIEGLEDGEWVRRAMVWEPIPTPAPVLTANEFVRRFTAEEQAVIWASTEPNVVVLRNLVLSARDGIRLDDPETTGGMALLVGLGLLSEARGAAILTA